MPHTIKQAAELTNLTPVTLRYYEKQGLLPFVKRRESGYREFSDDDIAMLRVIECLNKSGMSIREIRQFSEWVLAGGESLQERYEMFLGRKRAVEAQLADAGDVGFHRPQMLVLRNRHRSGNREDPLQRAVWRAALRARKHGFRGKVR